MVSNKTERLAYRIMIIVILVMHIVINYIIIMNCIKEAFWFIMMFNIITVMFAGILLERLSQR